MELQKYTKIIETMDKEINVLNDVLNYILTVLIIIIENESICCTEAETSLYKKEPGFPITLKKLLPDNEKGSEGEYYNQSIIYRGIYNNIN